MRGAVTCSNNSDVVACACAAIFTLVSEKGGNIPRKRGGLQISRRELVLKRQFLEAHVVGMDMLSRFDRNASPSHYLAISDHAFAGRNRLYGDFMAGRNVSQHFDGSAIDPEVGAGREWHPGDSYVIRRMEMDGRILGGGDFRNLEQAHL
jgi:hypothetical protein